MDFQCIETLLELPEFRVTGQVIRPREVQFSLERRDTYLVCPYCQGSCARIKEDRERCLRDLPIFDRPVTLRLHLRRFQCPDCHHRPWEKSETFGERVKWTERLYDQVRQEFLHGCPGTKQPPAKAEGLVSWTESPDTGPRPVDTRDESRIARLFCHAVRL